MSIPPPLQPPQGALLLSSLGAKPGQDVTAELQAAVDKLEVGKQPCVWIDGEGTTPIEYNVSANIKARTGVTVAGPGQDYVAIIESKPEQGGIFGGIADSFTAQDLTLDTQTHLPAGASPQNSHGVWYLCGSHNILQRCHLKTGVGFGARFVGGGGAEQCQKCEVGDNHFLDLTVDALCSGGGFVALDMDCQGLYQWTQPSSIVGCTVAGQVAIFLSSYVLIDEHVFTPNKNEKPCDAPFEITTTGKYGLPSHDVHFTNNIKSNGGKIKVEYYSGATNPMTGLVLPTTPYWNPKCAKAAASAEMADFEDRADDGELL